MKSRIRWEKEMIYKMISIYCRGNKHCDGQICDKCSEILKYVYERLDNCPFGEKKSFCKKCPVHCYKPGMRREIKKIMKYSGPRIIFVNPLAAIRHILE